MGGYIVVTTTAPDENTARELSKRLVESRSAACVQVVGPVASTYTWKGAVETAEEWLLLVKAPVAMFERIEKIIGERHPYEVPEIVGVPVARGSADYLSWIDQVTGT